MHMLEKSSDEHNVTDDEVARRLETFLASTPPDSDHDHESQLPSITIAEDPTPSNAVSGPTPFNKYSLMDLPPNPFGNINHHQDDEMLFSSLPIHHDFDDGDFDSLLNLDAVGEAFNFDEAIDGGVHGLGDVDWLAGGTPAVPEEKVGA
jgi:hypothetical protein